MAESNTFAQRASPVVLKYGLAVSSVGVALIFALLLRPDVLIAPVFFLAIMLSAWFGGMGPGLLAALLSTLAIDYFFLPPLQSLKFDLHHAPHLVVFFLSALLVSSWSAVRRRAETLLRRARDEMDVEVQERTADLRQSNQQLQAEVAERKQAEDAMREQASLLNLTHDTVFARGMNDVITYWNRGAEELYGWTSGEAVGQVTHDILQTVFPAPLNEIMEQLTRTDRWEGPLVHTRRDGTHVRVASRWALQRNQQGQPVAILETNNDITERNRAEEALQKVQSDLAHVTRVMTMGELVASIAHEVNQPLGAIVANGHACVRLLSRDDPSIEKSLEVIQRMIKDGMRASEVIKRIRELLHKTPPEKAPLNINEAILEVVALVSGDVLRSKVELKTELATDLPPVVGDRIQLQQVILNLILNGKDAMSSIQSHPRELLITSRKNNSGEAVVAVRDSGAGLDPKQVGQIFEPFFTTKAEGMGLGLSISRTIVEAHGGTLWATPNEDKGATIQFTLQPGSRSES
jgi:two-component system, LuxR family, sensor kinase FixL